MSSGPNIRRSQRVSPAREITLQPDVDHALDVWCERTKKSRSAVIDEALRVMLGLPPRSKA